MIKKKCAPCYVAHPIVCGAVVGLAIIGLCGVVMAMKKKTKKLGKAVKQLGSDCVDKVEQVTEDMMQSGMDMMQRMTKKDCGC
ncbi:MAG: hypothetical protein IJ009_04540 [Clostridia bacterium]|nr:hypothetical protein [Clostridia bacterium]